MVSLDLREFLHRMQMNIRDIDSKNYEEMRECEVDTKVLLVGSIYTRGNTRTLRVS